MSHSKLSYVEQVAQGLVKLSPTSRQCTNIPISEKLIMVVDCSGSMDSCCGSTTRLGATQDAIMVLLNKRVQLGADDEMAAIAFHERAHLVLPFTPCRTQRSAIELAVRSIEAKGGTSLTAGFQAAWKILPVEGTTHVVCVSDGHGGPCWEVTDRMKEGGVIIETIGIGNNPSEVAEDILKGAASILNGEILYRFIREAKELAEYSGTQIANRLVKRSGS